MGSLYAPREISIFVALIGTSSITFCHLDGYCVHYIDGTYGNYRRQTKAAKANSRKAPREPNGTTYHSAPASSARESYR
ncbi:hypothetical protein CONLIGDRAFT_687626 [Coniochaeta ligniaria NRRL 30616]|uniref:Uncharacterized protein n=1 Tax=Coniochaeta ligniaria NRRL 30616 TaxID=1408157 RepID=A0A1J7I4R5_9PEZI|nr:hypothetical protein CONLIGDRAFT_687626 [Coniochaeta ligniaria NRRL 30616]